jgi:hypothetical protein
MYCGNLIGSKTGEHFEGFAASNCSFAVIAAVIATVTRRKAFAERLV